MRDADYEWVEVEQKEHLLVKPKAEKKQRRLSQ